MRRLRAWLALLLVAVCCCLRAPSILAQSSTTQPAPAADNEESPAVPQHAVAFLCTALVLGIVCAPSRKG